MCAFGSECLQALRTLRRTPGSTFAAMLMLASGIGAIIALVSIAHTLLMGNPPYPQPERLLAVYQTGKGERGRFAHRFLTECRDRSTTLSALGGCRPAGFHLAGLGDPRLLRGARVTAGFFDALGTRAHLGRLFTREDEKAEASDKVILAFRLWHDAFGADPGIAGRSLAVDGRPMEVVGVLPRGFMTPFSRDEEIFKIEPDVYPGNQRSNRAYQAIGRLAPGATVAAAGEEMRWMAVQEVKAHPDSSQGLGSEVEPLHQALAEGGKSPFLFLLGAMGVLLLIACVNATKFFLVRTTTGERDLGTLLIHGGNRHELLRKFLAKAVVVVGGGILLALLLAHGLLRILEPFMLQEVPVSLVATGLQLPVRAFTSGCLRFASGIA